MIFFPCSQSLRWLVPGARESTGVVLAISHNPFMTIPAGVDSRVIIGPALGAEPVFTGIGTGTLTLKVIFQGGSITDENGMNMPHTMMITRKGITGNLEVYFQTLVIKAPSALPPENNRIDGN